MYIYVYTCILNINNIVMTVNDNNNLHKYHNLSYSNVIWWGLPATVIH